MSDISRVYIGNQAKSLDVAPQFDGYSKVVLNITDDQYYEAGTSTGRTLTLFCPWGTQAMCNNILASIKGYQYQPMDAQDAIIDPAAELGDGFTVKDSYSVLASMRTTFGPLLRANVSAPGEEEIDHEYPYKSPQERKITRQFASVSAEFVVQANKIAAEINDRKAGDEAVRAALTIEANRITSEVKVVQGNVDKANSRITQEANRITAEVNARKSDIEKVNAQFEVQAGQINAKVSKQGGSFSSFGWELTDSYMIWKANNSEIFRLDKNGAQVTGKIVAKSGTIGGFTIGSNYLTYGGQTWNNRFSSGVYLGPSGIALGKNFSVDNSGNINAYSGTFRGYINANMIRSDAEYGTGGYFNGAGLSGHSVGWAELGWGSVNTDITTGGINSSLGHADYAYDVVNGFQMAGTISARTIYTNNLTTSAIEFDGFGVRWRTISYKNSAGTTSSVTVLARS